jgi:hypothetical protein
VGNGETRELVCCPAGFGIVAEVGVVVLDGLIVVVGRVARLLEGVSALFVLVPHDTRISVRMVSIDKRARVLAPIRGWW